MLNLCIDWKKVEVEFMGEKVRAEICPPSPSHMLVIAPHLNFRDEEISEREATDRIYKMQKAVAPILPEMIRNIEGIKVNGNPLEPLLLGTEAALGPLAVNLLAKVFNHANLDRNSEKNLPSPPDEKSPGRIAAEQ